MSGISIHLSIKIRILSLKSISFAMSNAALGFYCYHYLNGLPFKPITLLGMDIYFNEEHQ